MTEITKKRVKPSPRSKSRVRPPQALAVETLDITVLAGGPGDEREVSLNSGRAVHEALLRLGHRAALRDIAPDELSALELPSDCVFIALHGSFGEDGQVQGILERVGKRYCGSGAAASVLCMDKAEAKRRLIREHVPTPCFEVATADNVEAACSAWPTPAVVKPVRSGSSVDTYIVRRPDALADAARRVIARHGDALIEQFIDGPELTVGLLDGSALPVLEIRPKREFYDYQAKYIDDDTEYVFDVDLPAELLARIQRLSLQAHDVLGCRDFCRVDWMVDRRTHQPYLLEINTIPGFTSHSLLPKAAARAGISFDQLCQRIVTAAMRREPNHGPC